MYEKIKAAADVLKEKFEKVDVVIVGGTGIDIKLEAEKTKELPYSDVPYMPLPSTKSHKGYFELFKKNDLNVVVAHGRFHYYERYTMQEVVFMVRALSVAGAKIVILTNAAGGLNPNFKKGDLMIVKDHINMMGANPLKGDNIDELGEKFPDMSKPYTVKHIEKFKEIALKKGIDLKEGVYVGVAGPSMETPAETRFFRMIGGDAIGMSTVPEIIALAHMNIDRVAISVITNVNKPDCMEKAPIDEVIKAASSASEKLSILINGFLEELCF